MRKVTVGVVKVSYNMVVLEGPFVNISFAINNDVLIRLHYSGFELTALDFSGGNASI